MRHIYLLIITLFLSVNAQNNVTVHDVVHEVKTTSIMKTIRHLESYGTRFLMAPNRFEIANWIKGEFESFGFVDVKLDTFEISTQRWSHPITGRRIDTTITQVNVVATLPGSENPEDIYIIGGHYDSYTDNDDLFYVAPGADDDASGIACVLEAASTIMQAGYQPKSTMVFIAFAAEELGYFADLMGSKHYAYEAAARGDNIKLVINNDMIGFNRKPIDQAFVFVAPTEHFTGINNVLNICETYGSINYVGEGYSGGDLIGFTEMGFPGIYFEEGDFSIQQHTNYHKNTDVSANIDSVFITEVIKAATAVLLSMEDVITSTAETAELPIKLRLLQNYPNPFNPGTSIEYQVSSTENIIIKVYDLLGRETKTLVNEIKNPGKYKVYFNANELASGVYFYSLIAGNYAETKKMILLK